LFIPVPFLLASACGMDDRLELDKARQRAQFGSSSEQEEVCTSESGKGRGGGEQEGKDRGEGHGSTWQYVIIRIVKVFNRLGTR